MSQNSAKRRLALFVCTTKCLVYVEAKFCPSEMHGEPKYYECPRTEYCCTFGCCVSPGFHFYHLWYYWLLVIIMFLVCSGGGWWYRYWLQGRYRAAASVLPSATPSSRTQNSIRSPTCQARITYNPRRNTVLLDRMWKGPYRGGSSGTPYNGTAGNLPQFQNTSVVLNNATCPYYQLYGPPPSYETVIAQSRSKVTRELSTPEQSRSSSQTVLNDGSHCIVYSCRNSSRINGEFVCGGSPQQRLLESGTTSCQFPDECTTLGQHLCIQIPVESDDYPTPQEGVSKRCALQSIDSDLDDEHRSTSSVSELRVKLEDEGSNSPSRRKGNSVSGDPELRDEAASSSTSSSKKCENIGEQHALSPQRSPSNNVILESVTLNNGDRCSPRINIIENEHHRLLTQLALRRTNSTLESKHKLDRSKSLE